MTDEPIVEIASEEEQAEETLTYHNPTKLIKLATWANTFSWIVLVVAIIMAFWQLYLNLQQMRQYAEVPTTVYVYYGGDTLLSLLLAGFYFLVLQAISEGITLLMDIFDSVAPEADEA